MVSFFWKKISVVDALHNKVKAIVELFNINWMVYSSIILLKCWYHKYSQSVISRRWYAIAAVLQWRAFYIVRVGAICAFAIQLIQTLLPENNKTSEAMLPCLKYGHLIYISAADKIFVNF